jgi:hypothetical protein
VTEHRVKFLIITPTRCTNFSNLFLEWNSTCFGQFLCPSSGVFHCTHSNGQRNCPKHVQFHSKNKFEKLVHLVGFIIKNRHSITTICTYAFNHKHSYTYSW